MRDKKCLAGGGGGGGIIIIILKLLELYFKL